MRQYEKAEADLDTALALRRKALEPTSYYTGETLEALADLYAATDRYARADSAYRAVLGIWDASGREDRAKRRAATLKSYAALLKKSGRSSNAKGPSTPDR
jgi:tetratricopeptide (TPR) repeat protein